MLTTPNHNFQPVVAQLGEVPLRARREVRFQRDPGGPRIRLVQTGCYCVDSQYDDTSITVSYQAPGLLPEYARQNGETSAVIDQWLTVYYRDDENRAPDSLRFQLTLINA